MAGLQNVRVCAQDLQLIRADRIISLLIPVATGYGAASPDDHALHRAVAAEIEGGTGGESLTRVRLTDCGTSPAAVLLAGLAAALGAAAAAGPGEGCAYVFAEHDRDGFTRWVTASQLPAAWPQSTATGSAPVAPHQLTPGQAHRNFVTPSSWRRPRNSGQVPAGTRRRTPVASD